MTRKIISKARLKRAQCEKFRRDPSPPHHQLGPEGKVIFGRKGVTNGPFAESKEGIAGYWFIQAATLEEAVEIAKGDPLLDYGHVVEIRPILTEGAPGSA